MMTVLPCANYRRFINGYELNITARLVDTDEAPLMTALIVHTVRVYVYLTKLIEAGATKVPTEHNIAADAMIGNANEFIFEPFSETRCTIFCWNHKIDLTLHSSDMPQQALDLYYAMEAAKVEIEALYPSQNAPNNTPERTETRETSAPATSAPKTQESTLNGGVTRVNGKKAIKELPNKAWFYMPVAKISAVMSPDGKLKWELFGFYGSNPGKFADLVIYADNENSIKNGLNAALTAIVGKPGQSVTGKWFAKGKVIEKDDKKSIYTNLLFNEQEELLNEKGDNHPGMADDITQYEAQGFEHHPAGE